ncbi:MAG: ricin-type beta-trefoil lectin domain protein [Saprospiraceae bacterium]
MKAIKKLISLSLLLALNFHSKTALAQSTLQADGNWHTIPYSGSYEDHKVPGTVDYPYIQFRVVGADGGSAKITNCDRVVGGAGAIVTAILEIGTTENEVPAGGTLRFIVGQGGQNMNSSPGGGAGGGGGSAVLLKVTGQTDPYRILAVAGGGGGGWAAYGGFYNCRNDPGNSAQTGTSGGTADGGDKDHKGRPGSDGQGAYQPTDYIDYGGGGGGAFSDAYYSNQKITMSSSGRKGGWTGGLGGYQNDPSAGSQCIKGGYGFGGGGGGYIKDNITFSHPETGDAGAGGGGGYSGGANGSDGCDDYGCGSAGGGGSYYHPGNYSGLIEIGDRTTDTHDGYIEYRFVKFEIIRLASDTSKCLDIAAESIDNGTNIQLGVGAQRWDFNGLNIRLAQYLNKCLDLSNSNTTNANNIQLLDCKIADAQHWVYDGVNKLIRSKVNPNKCVHVSRNQTTPGANIYIYDCSPGSTAQVWQLDGATTMPPDTKAVTIRSELTANKCLDLDNGNTGNGTNIQLWDCGGTTGTSNQQWYFDGLQIKLAKKPAKCLDLSNSNTNNGTNIQLYDCNNTNAQHWVYDGLTRAFRSSINLNKCIDVSQGGTVNGTNFQLYECNGTSAQQFTLGAVPCLMDTTPPVAKCKDAYFTQLTAPDVSDINNGSYDNCSIKSMDLRNASQSGVFILTVTDPSGNTSTCTGTVSFN